MKELTISPKGYSQVGQSILKQCNLSLAQRNYIKSLPQSCVRDENCIFTFYQKPCTNSLEEGKFYLGYHIKFYLGYHINKFNSSEYNQIAKHNMLPYMHGTREPLQCCLLFSLGLSLALSWTDILGPVITKAPITLCFNGDTITQLLLSVMET